MFNELNNHVNFTGNIKLLSLDCVSLFLPAAFGLVVSYSQSDGREDIYTYTSRHRLGHFHIINSPCSACVYMSSSKNAFSPSGQKYLVHGETHHRSNVSNNLFSLCSIYTYEYTYSMFFTDFSQVFSLLHDHKNTIAVTLIIK